MQYEELQAFLLEFELKSYDYGSLIFDSASFEFFAIIDEGQAASYRSSTKDQPAARLDLFGHGTIVGLDILENQVLGSGLPIAPYKVCAQSSVLKVYTIRKSTMIEYMKNHPQLIADVLQRAGTALQRANKLKHKISRGLLEKSLVKLEVKKQNCTWANGYDRMKNFISRKREQLSRRGVN